MTNSQSIPATVDPNDLTQLAVLFSDVDETEANIHSKRIVSSQAAPKRVRLWCRSVIYKANRFPGRIRDHGIHALETYPIAKLPFFSDVFFALRSDRSQATSAPVSGIIA